MTPEEKKELEKQNEYERIQRKESGLLGIILLISSFIVSWLAYSSDNSFIQFLCGFLIIPALFVFGVIYILDR